MLFLRYSQIHSKDIQQSPLRSWEIPEDCIMKTSYGDITWKSQPKETKSSFTFRVKEEVLKLPREHSRKEIYLWLFNE